MRRTLSGCLIAGLVASCAGGGAPPPRYEVFTIELVGHSGGERVYPGQRVAYRIRYSGDDVHDLRYRLVFTHESSGETASDDWSPSMLGNRIDEPVEWMLDHEFLKRSGRIRIQLFASVTPVSDVGSAPWPPWEARSQSVYVEHYPALGGIEVLLPAAPPLPYATPIEFRVTGADLRLDVDVTVLDVDTGAMVPSVEKVLAFDGTQTSLGASWTIRAPELEHVGTHHLALVARYGDLVLQSDPISFEVTHTLDEVRPLVRYADGSLWPSSYAYLSDVTGLGVRVSGTQLAGHEVRVNGAAPVISQADQVDLIVLTPDPDDFDAGKGRHTYEFVVRSGGMERRATVDLDRWGITTCGWRSSDGVDLGDGTRVARGTTVAMHAALWGFPDTTTYLWIFKSPQAEFTIWEADPAGRQWDPFGNNDDEIDSWDADIRSDETWKSWTTVYDEEFHLDPVVWNQAEYYFEVKVEDQLCTSGTILVPPP